MLNAKRIAITRSKDDASEFIQLCNQNKSIPFPLPTIELVSKGEKIVDEFLTSIKEYDPDYSVFMSMTGYEDQYLNWGSHNYNTFLKLKPNTGPEAIAAQLDGMMERYLMPYAQEFFQTVQNASGKAEGLQRQAEEAADAAEEQAEGREARLVLQGDHPRSNVGG